MRTTIVIVRKCMQGVPGPKPNQNFLPRGGQAVAKRGQANFKNIFNAYNIIVKYLNFKTFCKNQ